MRASGTNDRTKTQRQKRSYQKQGGILRRCLRLLGVILGLLVALSAAAPAPQLVSASGDYDLFFPSIFRSESSQGALTTNVLIPFGATWKYLDNGTDQGSAWRGLDFNDGSWKTGPAELGYGDGDERTVLSYGPDASHKYTTTYFRGYFVVSDKSSVQTLTLKVKRDDGAVVFLNGAEVYRTNLPVGEITALSFAENGGSDTVQANIDPGKLNSGLNVVAVEIHQVSPTSSDISFNLELSAGIGAPQAEPTETPTTKPTPLPTVPPAEGHAWYVTTNGSSSGSGTMGSPWSLAYALSHPAQVQPGDIIWVRGGKYGSGGDSPFESSLEGSSGKYITVRAYPGEKVTIDGGIFIQKPYTIFWGFEVFNSNPIRISAESGSDPSDIHSSDGFGVYASYTKLINNVIHDTNGIGAWESAVDVELYGNVVYNSGWEGPDRGHGHGMYMQNDQGTKTIADNIIFNNFSNYNVHIYTEKAHIQGFTIQGNVSVNGNFLVGGLQPAASILVDQNFFYNSLVELGYSPELVNHDLTLTNNVMASDGSELLEMKLWDGLRVKGNVFHAGSGKAVLYDNTLGLGSFLWDDNSYFSGSSTPFVVNGVSKNWTAWLSSTGFDGSSTYQGHLSSGVEVFIRPNQYEAERVNIIAFNWDRKDSISVDLTGTNLKPGDNFVLHNGFNWNETITGIYQGQPISVPMTGWTIAKPNGYTSALAPAPYPQFGVFVLDIE